MSLAELLPSVHALPRCDKFRLMQELIAELAQEEGLAAGEYPVWSPYEAHDAAESLMRFRSGQGDAGVIEPARYSFTGVDANHTGASLMPMLPPTV